MRQTSTFGALFIGQWAGTFGGKRAGERPHRLVPARAIRHYLLTALPGLTISYLGFRRKTAFRQKTVVNYKTQRGRQIWAITAKFRLFFFFFFLCFFLFCLGPSIWVEVGFLGSAPLLGPITGSGCSDPSHFHNQLLL